MSSVSGKINPEIDLLTDIILYIYNIYIYEKGMAIHSNILAWRIPWTEKPGGLHSVGSQRVRHD